MSYGVRDFDYFQRQKELHCGVHAINNLWGGNYTSFEELTEICKEIEKEEYNQLGIHEEHCDMYGNFSVQVIARFYKKYNIPTYVYMSGIENVILNMISCLNGLGSNAFRDSDNEFLGFVVSNSRHWITIKMYYSDDFYGNRVVEAVWIDSLKTDFPKYDIQEEMGMRLLIKKLRKFFNNGVAVGFVAVFNTHESELYKYYLEVSDNF